MPLTLSPYWPSVDSMKALTFSSIRLLMVEPDERVVELSSSSMFSRVFAQGSASQLASCSFTMWSTS